MVANHEILENSERPNLVACGMGTPLRAQPCSLPCKDQIANLVILGQYYESLSFISLNYMDLSSFLY